MMEQDRKEYLDKDESEKMCSSKIGEAGEMCSPADTDTCGNMRSLSEDKCNARSLNLETQLFWRAKREQNFLESCQGALATQRSISTDHAIAVHDWRAQSAKTEWKQRTAEACASLTSEARAELPYTH